ncbi:MAG: hypothetical protein NZ901_07680 [Geminocystis sp.]|nr:hypothetical protein [Geminocystis sp.]MCS7148052.1 hypothetical protein [Geminocystis sp.]MDW8116404.1 hypothetical protein [Geminocystis sp.]MDW8462111.1 hypothetical protein [Geminocystis sp.]
MEKVQLKLGGYIDFITKEINGKIYRPVEENDYLGVLFAIRECVKPIGVAGGRSLCLAKAERIIGVKPTPSVAENERYKMCPKTSD